MCIRKKFVKCTETFFPFGSCTGWIATKDIESQIPRHGLYLLSHIAYADYTEIIAVKLYGSSCRHSIQSREDILHHASRIAALSIMYSYPLFSAILKVDVIHADCRSSNYLYICAIKKSGITSCACADDYRICINEVIVTYRPSIDVYDLSIRFEDTFKERNIFICYYLHNYFKTNVFTAGPPLGSCTKRSSFARNSFIF